MHAQEPGVPLNKPKPSFAENDASAISDPDPSEVAIAKGIRDAIENVFSTTNVREAGKDSHGICIGGCGGKHAIRATHHSQNNNAAEHTRDQYT